MPAAKREKKADSAGGSEGGRVTLSLGTDRWKCGPTGEENKGRKNEGVTGGEVIKQLSHGILDAQAQARRALEAGSKKKNKRSRIAQGRNQRWTDTASKKKVCENDLMRVRVEGKEGGG